MIHGNTEFLSGGEIETILRNALSRDSWMTLPEIYELVERIGRLQPSDWEPDAPRSNGVRWQRNVRNVLQKRKSYIGGGGIFEWDGRGRYRLG